MDRPYDYLICDACGKINPELDNPESGSRITKCCPRAIGNYGKTFRPDSGMLKHFKYHTSWDWLMPVYYKVRDVVNKNARTDLIQDEWKIRHNKIGNAILYGDIEIACEQIAEFIKWYNSNPPLTKPTNER